MTPEEIKEYLGTMVEVEKECYLHERLLQTLKKRIASLGQPKKFTAPVKRKKPSGESLTLSTGFGGAMLGLVGGFVVGVISDITIDDGMTWGVIILGILGLVIGFISDASDDKKKEEQIQLEYDSAIQNYNQLVEADKIRTDKENKALVYLNHEYTTLQKSYNTLKDTRAKLYGMNIIFEKYRCFTAVSSLYEYFCAGRYTTLGEAYNQLELEARLDRISLQLNVVIAKLEQIKENQYTIYSAITDANTRLNSLIQSSSRIEAGVRNLQLQGEELNARVAGLQATSDLNLYINAMNNQELSYMRRWMTY